MDEVFNISPCPKCGKYGELIEYVFADGVLRMLLRCENCNYEWVVCYDAGKVED